MLGKAPGTAHWRVAWPELPTDAVWQGFLCHLVPMAALARQRLLWEESQDIQGQRYLARAERLAENLSVPVKLVEWDMGRMVKSNAYHFDSDGQLVEGKGFSLRRGLLKVRDALLFGGAVTFGAALLLATAAGAACWWHRGMQAGWLAAVAAFLCPFCLSWFLRRFLRG